MTQSVVSAERKLLPRQLILVGGMHRSGTSLLSQVLRCLGVDFPGPLIGDDKFNSWGYFERIDITNIQDQLLVALGRTWSGNDGYRLLPQDWLNAPCTLHAANQIKEIIKSESGNKETPWAIKDPRISLLLPMWLRLSKELNLEIALLVAVRHPAEVSRSLINRDQATVGMNSWKSQLLWWRYNKAILTDSEDIKPVFIDYRDWREQPTAQLDRLVAELKLTNISPTNMSNALKVFDYSLQQNSPAKTWRSFHPKLLDFYDKIRNHCRGSQTLTHLRAFALANELPKHPVHLASKIAHRWDRLWLFRTKLISPPPAPSPIQIQQRWRALKLHAQHWPHEISPSILFSNEWVYQQKPDLRYSDRDPLVWYLRYGHQEGITCHPLISRSFYASQFPKEDISEPVGHYLDKGWRKQASTHPLFQPDYYQRQCLLKDMVVTGPPLVHFLEHGAKADIGASKHFDPKKYRSLYPDVAISGYAPLIHYLIYGWKEGRSPGGQLVSAQG